MAAAGMSIGEVGRRMGLEPSAVREVLRIGLDCGCFRLEDCGALLDAGRRDCRLPVEAMRRPRCMART